mgnify:CR=1 FL=1
MEYSVKTLTTKNIPKFSVVRTSEMGPLGMTREDGSQYTEDLNLLLKNNQVINCIVREGIVKLFLSKSHHHHRYTINGRRNRNRSYSFG